MQTQSTPNAVPIRRQPRRGRLAGAATRLFYAAFSVALGFAFYAALAVNLLRERRARVRDRCAARRR
jgi:hypothetical protein